MVATKSDLTSPHHPPSPQCPPALVDVVEKVHAVVDELSAPIERTHQARLHCKRGCTGCCVDDLSVFEVEAAAIRRHYGDLLETEHPHPKGACAFLDAEGGCRIYEHRPYVCRTQGLPLRWIDEVGSDPNGVVERRDICPLNEAGAPIETLAPEQCWTLGPIELRLSALQNRVPGRPNGRVRLRDLFLPDRLGLPATD